MASNGLLTKFSVLMVVVGSTAIAAPARATVYLSENFNEVAQGLNATNIGPNFNVTAGTVDVAGTGFYDFYPGNGNYIDLDGSTYQLGTIQSKVFAAGSYTLSFDLGAYTYNHAAITENTLVSLGDFSLVITPGVDSSATPGVPFEHYSFTFTTNTAGALTFAALNPDCPGDGTNIGNILDNVLLTSAVPEPSTWAMMILGFCGLSLLAYRKRNQLTTLTTV